MSEKLNKHGKKRVNFSNMTKKDAFDFIMNNAIIIVLFALMVVIIAIEPRFISVKNFTNILTQASTRTIFALGVGTIIVAKGTDLSLGRQVGLAAVISASLLQAPGYLYKMYPDLPTLWVIAPILLVMLITAFFSGLNGIIVAKFKVDPFIATLGMMVVVYGVTSIYYDRPPYGAQPIGGLDPRFAEVAQGYFSIGDIIIPYLVLYAIIAVVFTWFLWNKTRFGKNLFAVGGNAEAAAVSGVSVGKMIIMVYVFAGLLYGLGGALEAARIGSATNNTGNGYELDAIAACIVGGLSFSGGIGSIAGIVTGVLIFQVIAYGLSFIGVNPYLQFIIKGLIIVVAVAIDNRKYIKRK